MLLKSFLHVLVFEEKFEPIESTERMCKMFKKKALSANRGQGLQDLTKGWEHCLTISQHTPSWGEVCWVNPTPSTINYSKNNRCDVGSKILTIQ